MKIKQGILFLITKSEVGGAQKYVREQIAICSKEFEVYLSTNEPGWLTEHVAGEIAGQLLDKRIESRTSIGYLTRLAKYIKEHGIGLVVTNSANAGMYGRIAAKMAGAASIYVSHGWSSVYNGGKLAFLLNRIERYLARLGDKVICVSAGDYEVARDKVGIAEDKLVLLKNCIFPVNATAAADRPAANGRLKLLSVARFAHPKRMDLLVAAMKGVTDAELYLVGGGKGEEEIRSYVHAQQLDNVHLLGEIKSFNGFGDYDAFVLISESEGLPMSGLEAMSAGMPLILSNVGGCKEIVVNESLLVNNTVEDIQRAIRALQHNYVQYKMPVKSFFDINFNLLVNQDKYLGLYRSLIK
ncbi:glycosyltransferase [Chitinophaga nivalis]|uniref:Glycosyltransferase n=1 Tax=Chitinophaga nivalis TaxID=2991709 RepID=A0ABT3IW83_9BACT|nr:glycosyltransferase [Chitinophaga nivalis]MCW3462073.1 glycosyltransferase [Chitinophaga nivalis]MCW3488235.1 glycosyltransferase [Chitinophaga nivalis]